MFIPKRYISCNVNLGWRLEGRQYQSIDLKELIQVTSFRNKIDLLFTCGDCGNTYGIDIYPTNKISKFVVEFILHLLLKSLE